MNLQPIEIFNTLTRRKEKFIPLNPPFVGMYVCGPTVYNDIHLGNCRTFISFDLIYRYLIYAGYKVRYVRNITDAGHLEGDRDEGEDKFAKKAKLEQLEPMEIVQKYTLGFHEVMRLFNTLPPSIEPTATGHISEQIEMTKRIIKAGYAYISNGTVYFDVEKYSQKNNYGVLSNRKPEELLEGTRELSGQDGKKSRLDFALWIEAKPEHLMRWLSPWGVGFPGWHIECSAMSTKYLGKTFDIHGGGMDLIATHHTNEIAQSQACNNCDPVKYWMHTNMLTVNDVRMSKSAGNGFLPMELFTGKHQLLDKGYSPMAVRYFMLSAHYRSTLDFSNKALDDARKNYRELALAFMRLNTIIYKNNSSVEFDEGRDKMLAGFNTICNNAMNDDFNSVKVLSEMGKQVHNINAFYRRVADVECVQQATFEFFRESFNAYFSDVLGLLIEEWIHENKSKSENEMLLNNVLDAVLNIRKEAKNNKDFIIADKIRNELEKFGIKITDTKEGANWEIQKENYLLNIFNKVRSIVPNTNNINGLPIWEKDLEKEILFVTNQLLNDVKLSQMFEKDYLIKYVKDEYEKLYRDTGTTPKQYPLY